MMKKIKKKKLVFLVPQMRHGGAERVVSRLSFLMNNDFDTRIVVFDDSIITYEVGCELISLNVKPNPRSNIIMKAFNVIKRIYLYNIYKKRNNIDITYSFGDTANIVNVFSSKGGKKITSFRGFKRIRTGKSFKERFLLKPISKLICKKSDSIVSVSELMTKTIAKEYEISQSKINTIYNGYDSKNILKLSKKELSNNECDKIGLDRLIVTAGTFRSPKGYWHLIKAFSIVLQKENNVKLLILGEDDDGNKQKIEKLAKALNVSEKIIYGGYQINPFKYFSKSVFYVLSSTSEGFPNAMVEAMSSGLPIIASDCNTGPREILAPKTDIYTRTKTLEYGEYGILVKPMTEQENYDEKVIEECDHYLAEAMLKMLSSIDLRTKYVKKSKQRALDFSYNTWVEKHYKLFMEE